MNLFYFSRLESLSSLSMNGVNATKALLKSRLRRRVAEVAEEETRTLVRAWTAQDFPRNLKQYLRNNKNRDHQFVFN